MSEKKSFTIQEFAHLTGIKRDNLRFYDRIGLLSPQSRGENGYRFYSRMQLNSAYLIYTLRSLGVSIEEIRQYVSKDSSDSSLTFFLKQQRRVEEELKRLQETRNIIKLYAQFARDELQHTDEVFLIEKKQEAIFLCPIIPENMDDDEAIILAYDYASAQHINTGYPLGAIISHEQIMKEDRYRIQRYYFLQHGGKKCVKAAGLYAVAYCNSSLDSMKLSYLDLKEFIKKHNLRICGDAFEEYLLEDLSRSNHQGVRIEIPVCNL